MSLLCDADDALPPVILADEISTKLSRTSGLRLYRVVARSVDISLGSRAMVIGPEVTR